LNIIVSTFKPFFFSCHSTLERTAYANIAFKTILKPTKEYITSTMDDDHITIDKENNSSSLFNRRNTPSIIDSTTNISRPRHLRRDLEEEEKKEDISPTPNQEQQQQLGEDTKIEDVLLYPPKKNPESQQKEEESQKDNIDTANDSTVTMNDEKHADAGDIDTAATIAIPPRPPLDVANANTSSGGERVVPQQTLEDSHLEILFPTATPIAKQQPSTQVGEEVDYKNSKQEPEEGPPYPMTNATLADLAHQEIENWFGDGPDLSWTDEGENDESKEPSEMEIVIPATVMEEELIDEEMEEWEEDHGKPKQNIKDGGNEKNDNKDSKEDKDENTNDSDEEDGEQQQQQEKPSDKETSIKDGGNETNDNKDNKEDKNENKNDSDEEDDEQQQQQEKSNDKETSTKAATPPLTPGMTVTVTLEPVASPFVSPTLSPIEIKKKEPSKRNPPPLPSKLVPTISPTTEKPCHSLSAHTVAHFSCETGAPSIILY